MMRAAWSNCARACSHALPLTLTPLSCNDWSLLYGHGPSLDGGLDEGLWHNCPKDEASCSNRTLSAGPLPSGFPPRRRPRPESAGAPTCTNSPPGGVSSVSGGIGPISAQRNDGDTTRAAKPRRERDGAIDPVHRARATSMGWGGIRGPRCPGG